MVEVFVVLAVRGEELEKLGEFEGDDHPADALARAKCRELNVPVGIRLEVRDENGTVVDTQDWVGYLPEDDDF